MKFNRLRKGLALALLCAVFAGCALLSGAGAVSVTDFTDVKTGQWYYEQVSYAVSEGLFYGTSQTAFSPNGAMTRGMFISVLGRLAGVKASDYCKGTVTGSGVYFRKGPGTSYGYYSLLYSGTTGTITGKSGNWYAVTVNGTSGYIYGDYFTPSYHRFDDVSYGQYYAGFAIWAYEKGIVSGTDSSAVFSPDDAVTREQICRILHNYTVKYSVALKNTEAALTFTDDSRISSWAYADVYAMQKAGVVHGSAADGGYAFDPQGAATRAQVATMFYCLDRAVDTAATPAPTPVPTAQVTSQPTAEPSATPVPTPAATPGDDTPATLIDQKISIGGNTVKIGLFVKTKSYDTTVNAVRLFNCRGEQYEYGYISADREFISQGVLDCGELIIYCDDDVFSVYSTDGDTLYQTSSSFALRGTGDNGEKPVSRVNGEYRYYGAFEFKIRSGSEYFIVINVVDIEDYVRGVIPYEFSNTWPLETLKAAAVAARTYIMNAWGNYASYGYDLICDNGAQTYRGRAITYKESYFTTTDRAVDETANQYLTYDGKLCTCFYFSSDGGATEDYGHIYSGSIAYLKGKVDPYEAKIANTASSYYTVVTRSRTGSTLQSLASKLGLSTIAQNGISIATYPATGNVKSITVTDVNGKSYTVSQSSSITRWNFLSYFGFTGYSYRFSVKYDASADSFTITRYGWGHNLGMSQWGAYSMAYYYGKNYQDILGFYYDGTHLQLGDS